MKNEKEIHNSLSIIAKSSLIVLIFLFISKVLTYVYRIIIARHYGPEIYGNFSLALMIFGFFVAVSSLGLIDGLSRFVPLFRGKNQQKNILIIYRFSRLILLISGLFSCCILFFISDKISLSIFHSEKLIPYLKTFAFLIPLNIFLNLYLVFIRSYEKITIYSFIQNILQNAIKLLVLSLIIFLGISLDGVLLSYSLGVILSLLFAYLFFRYNILPLFGLKGDYSSSSRTIKKIFSYSWPIIFLSIVWNLMYWIDSFSIGFLRNSVEVGIYSAAIPLANLFAVSTEIFMQIFFPLITKEYSLKNMRLVREISKQIGKWIFIINLPLFFFMTLFPGAIINLLFGSNYLGAENALRILSIGNLFYSISMISGNILLIYGKSKFFLYNLLGSAILNGILNFILIRSYGIMGAAIGTSVSLIVSGSIFIYQAKKLAGVLPLRKKMIRIFLTFLVPFFIIIVIKNLVSLNLFNIFILVTIFSVSYAMLILFTGCLDKYDLRILIKIKNNLALKRFIAN